MEEVELLNDIVIMENYDPKVQKIVDLKEKRISHLEQTVDLLANKLNNFKQENCLAFKNMESLSHQYAQMEFQYLNMKKTIDSTLERINQLESENSSLKKQIDELKKIEKININKEPKGIGLASGWSQYQNIKELNENIRKGIPVPFVPYRNYPMNK